MLMSIEVDDDEDEGDDDDEDEGDDEDDDEHISLPFQWSREDSGADCGHCIKIGGI